MNGETCTSGSPYVPFEKFISQESQLRPNPFELQPVFDWYIHNQGFLTDRLDNRLALSNQIDSEWIARRVTDPQLLPLSMEDVRRLLGLFPQSIHDCSQVARIQAGGALWYHLTTTPRDPLMTTNPHFALSPTALILSSLQRYAASSAGIVGEVGVPPHENRMMIRLNRIAHQATTDLAVSRLATAEILIHEYAKAAAINMIDNGYIRLPDGRLIDGEGFIMNVFEFLCEARRDPVSYVSSQLRHTNGTFAIAEHHGKKPAVLRELAEGVTLKLLGYNAGPYVSLTLSPDPLRLWPEIDTFINDFLQSTLVSPDQAEKEPTNILRDLDLTEEYLHKALK